MGTGFLSRGMGTGFLSHTSMNCWRTSRPSRPMPGPGPFPVAGASLLRALGTPLKAQQFPARDQPNAGRAPGAATAPIREGGLGSVLPPVPPAVHGNSRAQHAAKIAARGAPPTFMVVPELRTIGQSRAAGTREWGVADASAAARVEAASCRFARGPKAARRRFYLGQRPFGSAARAMSCAANQGNGEWPMRARQRE